MAKSKIKKAKPVSTKSTGTDDPNKYIGGWESYTKSQGINDKRDPKVLAMEEEKPKQTLSQQVSNLANALGLPEPEGGFSDDPLTSLSQSLGLKPSAPPASPRGNHHPDVGDDIAMESAYGGTDASRTGVPDTDTISLSVGGVEQDEIKKSRKAPMKQVRANAKALSARGKPPALNPYKIMETIRRPVIGTLSNEYEIIDDDENTIGFSKVVNGIIESMDYSTDAAQDYRGEILSAMLSQIVSEADHHRANLSIQVTEDAGDIKYILERFGFRLAGGSVMKRNAGAIRPTSVQTTAGMSNR
jgi:hypothetical protein